MLKIENITTGYGKKQILFDISFEVNKGDMILLAGSNGSGKSTLLKAIYGMLPLWNRGDIFFENERINGSPTAALLKKGILFIPQKNNLFEELTVIENLEMAGLTLNSKLLQVQIEKTLGIFTTLRPHLKSTVMKMSGGERQLLTLAMAFLHQPKMILLDEPFTGLSPQNVTFVANTLQELNKKQGITFLIVEHRVKECSQITNKVIALKLGRIFSESHITEDFNISKLHSVFV